MLFKKSRNYLTASIFTILACLFWFMGYIKVPYFDTRADFWLGFFSCASLFILGYLLFKISDFSLNIKKFPKSDAYPKERTRLHLYSFVITVLIVLLAISCIYFFVRLRINEDKLTQSNSALLNATDQASNNTQLDKVNLVLGLVQKLDSVKLKKAESPLAHQLLSEIISLGNSLKIDKEWDPQRKTYQELSIARGMLLLALCNANLDSISFMKIKSSVSFAGADLRNSEFTNIDLSEIDLRGTNFENSRLVNCNLSYSNFEQCTLLHCTLKSCNFFHASIKSTNMSWSSLEKINFISSYADSVNFSNSTLDSLVFKYATLIEANISNSKILNCDFSYAHLKGTNFTMSKVNNCKLLNATINHAHFTQTYFINTFVDESWINKYSQYLYPNKEVAKSVVKLSIDSTSIKDSVLFKLTTEN